MHTSKLVDRVVEWTSVFHHTLWQVTLGDRVMVGCVGFQARCVPPSTPEVKFVADYSLAGKLGDSLAPVAAVVRGFGGVGSGADRNQAVCRVPLKGLAPELQRLAVLVIANRSR